LLGVIMLLAIGSGYIVFNNTNKYPFEFKRGLDIQGGMHLVLQAKTTEKVKEITPPVMSAAIAAVRNRVDGLGVSEPLIQPKGEDQIIVDMPGIKDKEEALRIIGTTAQLTFRAHKTDFPTGQPAPVWTPAPTASGAPGAAPTVENVKNTQQDWVLTGLDGTMITSARVEPQGSSWAVTAEFNGEGAKLLGDISRQLLNKPMGIFLDNKLISDPIVRSELPSGNVQITGNFDVKEANELMTFLKAGSLPVPLEVIENRTVEASLGNESVKATLISGIIGGVAVMIFMVAVYQLPGLLANIALIIYSLLVLAIFKIIPVTLTVPGVAAFILSVGMAVDANILIFERTKEELRDKRTLYAAIEIGFKRAFSAIFDSNVNSLITCAILFYFGTGPVKGFALTLAIGVVISMFTAITATRSLLHWVLEARQERRALGKGGEDGGTLFGVKMPSKIR
jgi:preprotein translocase subunit SecD